MTFPINPAHAQAGAPPGGGGMELLILVGVFFLLMYFLVIRPQNKRTKAHKELIGSLAKGDEITTSGGLLGRITAIGENFISIEISDGVEIKVQKQSVSAMMPKGTAKNE